jgi:L-ribulose-5-phosphate 3-epimerase
MTRRGLITLAGTVPVLAAQRPRFIKSITATVFPPETPCSECLRQSKNAGFDAIELRMDTKGDITLEATVEQMTRLRAVAESVRIEIASLWILTPRSPSLASPKPDVRGLAVRMVKKGIELAPALGCGALLVVPGNLGSGARFDVTHDEAWKRSSEAFGELLPLAEKAKVMLTPENVWNKFLVSPLDMRSFIDQFHSPWVASHFDIGNVMQYGFPQDWIRTLGHRIKRVHLKDYQLSAGGVQGRFVPLLEGDVQWKEVMADLVKIGYRGYCSAELGPDPKQPDLLATTSRAVDRILSMA